MHEAFVRVWENRHDIHPDHIRGYLFRTATNLAANRRRWLKLRQFVSFKGWESTARSIEDLFIGKETAKLMAQAIDRLPEKQKTVLLLVRFADMSYQQVAETLGISSGTVASRVHHAMKSLKGVRDGSE